MTKKILTIDDLVQFCSSHELLTFNAEETGYQLCIQAPATFESFEPIDDGTMLHGLVKLLHTGRNENGSNVTLEAAENCMAGIKYKPLLANFTEVDGVRDFTSHDFEKDEDGNLVYIERQIGCFTAESPYMEDDPEIEGRKYVYAYVAIPRDYTDAAEIIERKNGTKISSELLVNKMSFDPEKMELILSDIVVQGATCLGVDPDTGEEVQEGMKGARLDIIDFSADNTPVQIDDSIKDAVMSALDKENLGKEEVTDMDNENTMFQKVFELSHEDVRCALYGLLAANEAAEDDYYCIVQVYDDHFVYQSWNTGLFYGQKYVKSEEAVSLDGERYEVFVEWLTEEEKTALSEMRANYSSTLDTLNKYETEPAKMEVLDSEDYALIAEAPEFMELRKQDNHFDLSVEEVTNKANEILLDYAKSGKIAVKQAEEPVAPVASKQFVKANKKASRYGNLFSNMV